MRFPVYPQFLEAILPIVDGWTPITTEDLNVYQGMLRRIEDVLGYGVPGTGLTGPKAGNSDVAARLDAFLEEDGRLHDIQFITGTRRLGDFSEVATVGGAFFPFTRPMSTSGNGNLGYHVLADFKSPETDGSNLWSRSVPSGWWTTQQLADGVRIAARDMVGTSQIDPNDDSSIDYNVLVIGYEAFVAS